MKTKSVVGSANEDKIGGPIIESKIMIHSMKTRLAKSEHDSTDKDKIASDYPPKAKLLKRYPHIKDFTLNVRTAHHSLFDNVLRS